MFLIALAIHFDARSDRGSDDRADYHCRPECADGAGGVGAVDGVAVAVEVGIAADALVGHGIDGEEAAELRVVVAGDDVVEAGLVVAVLPGEAPGLAHGAHFHLRLAKGGIGGAPDDSAIGAGHAQDFAAAAGVEVVSAPAFAHGVGDGAVGVPQVIALGGEAADGGDLAQELCAGPYIVGDAVAGLLADAAAEGVVGVMGDACAGLGGDELAAAIVSVFGGALRTAAGG